MLLLHLMYCTVLVGVTHGSLVPSVAVTCLLPTLSNPHRVAEETQEPSAQSIQNTRAFRVSSSRWPDRHLESVKSNVTLKSE